MRDASYIIGLNASSDAPIAFTLMGDGIDWKPVLWFAKRLRGLPVVMLYHHVLPQVTYCAESPGAFVAAVVDLLLSAVERPMWPTDWLSCDAKLTLSSGASMEVIRVLGTLRHAVVAVKVVDLWAAERLAPPRSPVVRNLRIGIGRFNCTRIMAMLCHSLSRPRYTKRSATESSS
jgi:hypothetical protein